MTIRLRTAFFIFLAILIIWFLYVERAILTPFVLAACFAYIINPIVNFFSHKIKLPRTVSVIIIYLLIMGAVIFAAIFLTKQITNESLEFRSALDRFVKSTKQELANLPDWLQPTTQEFLVSLDKSKFFSPQWFIVFFPQAISRLLSFLIFLFSTFYFLKEGRGLFDKLLHFVPNDYKIEVDILFRKVNSVLGGYLRGQLFLVVIVSAILFIALSILGIRFALILAIFSGFAEIVPIIGPFFAGFVACLVVVLTGDNRFGLSIPQTIVTIALTYFIVRQIQDYFITPHIMGKVTKLHPFIVFFAVLAGGHLAGILGLILAVPVAATIKILLEYSLDKVNISLLEEKKHPEK